MMICPIMMIYPIELNKVKTIEYCLYHYQLFPLNPEQFFSCVNIDDQVR